MPTVKIDGLDAMLRRLDALDKKVARKVLRSAVGKTTRAVARDVKRRVSKRTGQLRKAIGQTTRFRDGHAIGEVGAKRGKGGSHLHLVEFGTVGRVQRSTGRRTGTMPAKPILRPALKTAAVDLAINLRDAFRKETGAT